MFYSKETGWGYPEYMKWTDVEDPNKGFIKVLGVLCQRFSRDKNVEDGSVEFEVTVKADAEFVEKKCLNDKKVYKNRL